jgi:hypothetical protein
MLRRLLGALIALFVVAGGVDSAHAQENWVLLASKSLSPGGATETIDVSQAKGNYKALRLVARQGGLDISNIEVVYGDGAPHNERRNISFNQGDRTRPIDPRSAGRFVNSVVLSYRGRGQPAVVEVYGLQTSEGARAVRTGVAAAAQPSTPIPTTPTASAPSAAQPMQQSADGTEILFGTQTVGFGVDRDVIRIGAEVGKFDRVRMRVLDNDIFIRSMKVIYANGESDEIAYNAEIKKDSRTRWLSLKGDRFIKEIQMIYNSRPNVKGRAYVEVYGHYADDWLGPQGEGRKYNQGYVLLGAQTAGFTIDRNDIIRVGRNEGGFRKLRIDVKDEAITLFEVRVVYGNGDVDILPANRQRIEAGSSFGPLDLKGGTRVINEIRATYRTRIFQQGGIARGRALVQFWGQH